MIVMLVFTLVITSKNSIILVYIISSLLGYVSIMLMQIVDRAGSM